MEVLRDVDDRSKIIEQKNKMIKITNKEAEVDNREQLEGKEFRLKFINKLKITIKNRLEFMKRFKSINRNLQTISRHIF